MKVRAAVLFEMGAEKPYSQSRPLQIDTLKIDQPGRDELLVKVLASRSLPLRPVSNQWIEEKTDADGARS